MIFKFIWQDGAYGCLKFAEYDRLEWISVLCVQSFVFVYVNDQWKHMNLSGKMLIMKEFKLRAWFCGKVLNFYV